MLTHAEISKQVGFRTGRGGLPAYVGPLDGRTDVEYGYSVVRLLKTDYTGNALKIRRSSDNAETDIGFVAGLVDTAAALLFCGPGDGYCVKLYNQKGNGKDLEQATASKQPIYISSGSIVTGLNGKPTLFFDEAQLQCLQSLNSTYVNPASLTIFAIAGKRSNANYGSVYQFGFYPIVDFSYNSVSVKFKWEIYNNAGANAAIEEFSSINTSSIWVRSRVDHVSKAYTVKYKSFSTTTSRTGNFTGIRTASTGKFTMGANNVLSYYLSMDFHELIILNTDAGSTDFATLETNIETLFAI